MSLLDNGGGNPPAPPAPPNPPAPPGGQPPSDWVSGLTPELKNIVETKGYKTPADVVQAYANAERLIGVDKIPIPKDGVWDATARTKLGIPETPDKYTYKRPELPEGLPWDQNFEKAALTKAHELGLTPNQVQGLIDLYAGQRVSEFGGLDTMREQAQAEAAETLKKEWGNAYQVKLDNASRAAKMVGGDELVEALVETGAGNNPAIIRAFAKIGAMLGEDRMRSGQPSGFGLTPEEARAEATKLMSSPAYSNRNHIEHAEVVKKVESLFKQAYPDAV